MASGPFPFMRATFSRWCQLWRDKAGHVADAPVVLGVGDIHVENYGTWRDAEGRLAWGVNDFDEACHVPYTLDLVRLMVSVSLAIDEDSLKLSTATAFAAIIDGYTTQLKRGATPFVLAENHAWMRPLALNSLRDPAHFWKKMLALEPTKSPAPIAAVVALERMLPQRNLTYSVRNRVAGIGSLGHARFVAIACYQGGLIAREAKALVPPAIAWTHDEAGSIEILYQAILDRAVRCCDPLVSLQSHWIVRRLAPDCSRIELASLPQERDEAHILKAMGQELANVHAGTEGAQAAIIADIERRKAGWYEPVVTGMLASIQTDFISWKKFQSDKL